MIGYGSEDLPYVENPFAGRIREVHWSPRGVKWQGPQAYMGRGGLTSAPNSAVGTVSFWIRFYETTNAPPIITEGGSFGFGYNILAMAADGAGAVNGNGVGLYFGFRESGTNADQNFMSFGCTPFLSLSKWYHVWGTWDTSAGTAQIKVNGVSQSIDVEFGSLFAGFNVPWGNDPISSDQDTWMFGNPAFADVREFSLAEVWLDVENGGVDVSKFFDVTTGRRVALGDNGEIPTGAAPDFYFRRKGLPATFAENFGTAGAFVLNGDSPLHEPIGVRVE